MTIEIGIVLGLLVIAVIIFALEVISVDLITLLLLMALILGGVLTPAEAFAGFSSDIIIIIASIFVISGSLVETGVLDVVGSYMARIAAGGLNRMMLVMMVVAGGVSAFMNNTTTTALFLGPVMGVARKLKVSPSKVLIPLAYASIMGGTCTLIGTSTNVAVSGYLLREGLEPIGLFEITPIGLLILSVGILYMLFIGQHLLPSYPDESLTDEYKIREYLSEIIILRDSKLIGQYVFESDLTRLGFQILRILRGKRQLQPRSDTQFEAGDVVIVQGKVENLMKVKDTSGIEIRAEVKVDEKELQSDNLKIAEVLVKPQSDLVGRTLKEAQFRQRFGLTALAVYRHRHALREKIGDLRLRTGDMLLVQGLPDRFDLLRHSPDLAVLGELPPSLYRKRKGLYAIAVFAVALVLGGFGWLPLSVAFLGAAVLTILCRCISAEKAYEFIDWRLIILIGGMTAFGSAMEKTETAQFLAKGIVHLLQPYGVMPILAGFFFLTILLTQPLSNAAAALVVLPVALETAAQLDLNQRTFAIAIMLAASVSFIAPFEPSCVLVYGPGKYKFRDFIKAGGVLTILLATLVLFLIPVFWPLHSR